jgi:ribulose-5-phosphate 4-epimerase/fuculose-1-phosphate aldolase
VHPAPGQQGEVAEAARVLSALGLVTAFGHVSARSGRVMLITPAADLAGVTRAAIVPVPLDLPDAGPLPPGAPAEAWAHLALYRARPDAGAIARGQPASAFAAAAAVAGRGAAARGAAAADASALTAAAGIAAVRRGPGADPRSGGAGPPGPGPAAGLLPLHGQAAWLGERVPVHDSAHLLRTAGLARRAAADLPAGEALLLRGNGALTLGATPALAVTRMWLLAAACSAWLAAAAAGPVTPLTAAETASWRSAASELLPRLWPYLRHQALGPMDPDPDWDREPDPDPDRDPDLEGLDRPARPSEPCQQASSPGPRPLNGGRPARPDLGERSQT